MHGLYLSYTLGINQIQILYFYVKMNHFEVHLIVSSKVDFRVLRMAIQFEYLSEKKTKWRL